MTRPGGGGAGRSRLDAAVEAYRDRFGAAPGTFRLRQLGRDGELVAVIEGAVRDGERLDMEAVERRFGLPPLPPEATL